MDSNKIASELVKLAKNLVAERGDEEFDYSYLTDLVTEVIAREVNFIGKMNKALKEEYSKDFVMEDKMSYGGDMTFSIKTPKGIKKFRLICKEVK